MTWNNFLSSLRRRLSPRNRKPLARRHAPYLPYVEYLETRQLLSSLAVYDVKLSDGTSGMTSALFTVRLDTASAQTVTVSYGTADGSALASSDYTAVSGTLMFAPGETSQTVAVPLISDNASEPDNTFTLNLSGATGADIGKGIGVGTLVNDDFMGPFASNVRVKDATVTEGASGTTTALFTVSLDTASASTVTVNYATADGSATAPGDYTAVAGTLLFAPGATSQTVAVPVLGDNAVGPERILLPHLDECQRRD